MLRPSLRVYFLFLALSVLGWATLLLAWYGRMALPAGGSPYGPGVIGWAGLVALVLLPTLGAASHLDSTGPLRSALTRLGWSVLGIWTTAALLLGTALVIAALYPCVPGDLDCRVVDPRDGEQLLVVIAGSLLQSSGLVLGFTTRFVAQAVATRNSSPVTRHRP